MEQLLDFFKACVWVTKINACLARVKATFNLLVSATKPILLGDVRTVEKIIISYSWP